MHPYYGFSYPYQMFRAPDPSDVTQFKHSADQFMAPTLEMYHLLTQLSHSNDLALKIKEAASKSEHQKVEDYIKSAGVKSSFTLTYSPEGLILMLKPQDPGACFGIRLSICW
ncbi:hypothetical protein A8990_1298 [Paenibacillus taihuensis]|uniref:Uncharacterized protein n=1 Tax=Paenibacillus taihuensis TaxID=1156355 RepID=A0A3D9R601_9BACL|nr:hypothetical protein [Paenibacillus taihuensis]REE70523.1 hypothetical protein A8990_1298 [Paenibacillus taihuensis]